MAKDLKFFMREQKEEIVTAPGPGTILDDEGNPIELEIKVLSQTRIQEIDEKYRTRSVALDKRGAPYISGNEVVFKTEKDSARALRHIIAEALVYPNLKDKELMNFYNCVDITEMPRLVFSRANEYTHVSRIVFAALGLSQEATDDDAVEEIKNS